MLYFPATQSEHPVEPDDENLPRSQSSHFVADEALEYFPASQFSQLLVALYFPAWQTVHAFDPVVETEPEAQLLQEVNGVGV
jgi:hypothetical protein